MKKKKRQKLREIKSEREREGTKQLDDSEDESIFIGIIIDQVFFFYFSISKMAY